MIDLSFRKAVDRILHKANAVMAVLTAVTMDVPNLLINRALSKLEMIVQPATVMVTKFALDTPTPNSG